MRCIVVLWKQRSMNLAEDRKLLIEEIQQLKDERIIDAIKELLAFGKKYREDDDNEESSILKESNEDYSWCCPQF